MLGEVKMQFVLSQIDLDDALLGLDKMLSFWAHDLDLNTRYINEDVSVILKILIYAQFYTTFEMF